MRQNWRTIIRTCACICLTTEVQAGETRMDLSAATPPVANRVPKELKLHGEIRVDDYYWLREKTNPEVIGYLNAENAYTAAVMRPLKPLEEALYGRSSAGSSRPTSTSRTARAASSITPGPRKGSSIPIYCRKAGSLDAPSRSPRRQRAGQGAEVPRRSAPGPVSPDGHLLAYSTDVTGYREYTLVVKDLRTGELLPEQIPKVGRVAWAADNRTLFYGTEDAAKRPHRIYRHTLGADPRHDAIVYEEKDELFRVCVRRTPRQGVRLPLGQLENHRAACHPGRPARDRRPGSSCPARTGTSTGRASRRHSSTSGRTRARGTREFRLVTAPAIDPRPEHWKVASPRGRDRRPESIALFTQTWRRLGRWRGLPFLEVLDLGRRRARAVASIEFPEPAYSVFGDANPEYDTTSSVTATSRSSRRCRSTTTTWRRAIGASSGSGPRSWAATTRRTTSRSGSSRRPPTARGSRSLSSPGRRRRATARPRCLLYGYGSYGSPTPVTFNSSDLSLLDRGVIYAMAQVRGGGDLGKTWHDQRQDAQEAEHLHRLHRLRRPPGRRGSTPAATDLVIRGVSAGGLLIGAVVQPPAGRLQGRRAGRAVRGRDQHHVRRLACR